MRIKEIQIDSYGHFHNLQLELTPTPAPFTLIYGSNEAGKSTLHSFLRSILFGFQQKGVPSYTALAGGQLGGRLIIEKEGQLYHVERRTPPKRGAVTFYQEDGRILEGEDLLDLLGHVSAPLFKHIFAFGHQDLQKLESLQGEEVATYLYSAALGSGASQLVEVEKKMSRLHENMFKPRASLPPLNKLLKELEEEQVAVQNMRSQLADYTFLHQEWQAEQAYLNNLRFIRERMSKEQQVYANVTKLMELQVELRSLGQKKEKLTGNPLANASSNLLFEERKIKELEKELLRIDVQREQVEQRMEQNEPRSGNTRVRKARLYWQENKRKKLFSVFILSLALLFTIYIAGGLEQFFITLLLLLGLFWLTREQFRKDQEMWQKELRQLEEYQVQQRQLEAELEERRAEHHERLRQEQEREVAVKRIESQQVQLEGQLSSILRSTEEQLSQLSKRTLESRNPLFKKTEELLPDTVSTCLATFDLEEVQRRCSALEKEHEHVLKEIEKSAKKIGKLEMKLKSIAGEETYALKSQELEEKRAYFQQQAEQWATYALAEYLCQQIRTIYEEERQPSVLKQASRFFQRMTSGRYKQIIIPFGQKKIMAIRYDGQRLDVEQLSQGTVEQLYLAMRFAVIQDYEKAASLPIIIDDIFVNFDKKRAREALFGIKELSAKHQIIYFTCHEHMFSLVEEVLEQVNLVELA